MKLSKVEFFKALHLVDIIYSQLKSESDINKIYVNRKEYGKRMIQGQNAKGLINITSDEENLLYKRLLEKKLIE